MFIRQYAPLMVLPDFVSSFSFAPPLPSRPLKKRLVKLDSLFTRVRVRWRFRFELELPNKKKDRKCSTQSVCPGMSMLNKKYSLLFSLSLCPTGHAE